MACLAVWKAYEVLQKPYLKSGFEAFQRISGISQRAGGLVARIRRSGSRLPFCNRVFFCESLQKQPDPGSWKSSAVGGILELFCLSQRILCRQHGKPQHVALLLSRLRSDGGADSAGRRNCAKNAAGPRGSKLVPPEIMSDRYVFYRVPEFLLAFLDYTPRPRRCRRFRTNGMVCALFSAIPNFCCRQRKSHNPVKPRERRCV